MAARRGEGQSGHRRECFAIVALALFAAGCGHAAQKSAKTASAAHQVEMSALRRELAERDQRLGQLENRLALLEAEQRQLRFAVAEQEPPAGIRETVRIHSHGEGDRAGAADEDEPREPRAKARSAARPVLRLYEEPRREESDPLLPVPIVSERLPMMSMTANGLPSAGLPVDSGEHYRRAIDLVRQRSFDEALIALDEFLVRYPGDLRSPKVMFWRGEVLFAQREYARALSAFETALRNEPKGDKAADALFKIGLCHKRLGAPERARAAIERLKSQFPNSDAARMAVEEDA